MVLTLEEMLSRLHTKRVPELRGRVSQADLVLQEQDVCDLLHGCKSFDDIEVLINKMLVYIAMSKVS